MRGRSLKPKFVGRESRILSGDWTPIVILAWTGHGPKGNRGPPVNTAIPRPQELLQCPCRVVPLVMAKIVAHELHDCKPLVS